MTDSIRRNIIFICSISLALFHLYNGGIRPITADILRSIHIGFGLIIIFMIYPSFKGNKYLSITVDLFSSSAVAFWVIYYTLTLETMPMRTGSPIFMDILASTVGLVFLFEATRRILGWVLPTIAFVSLLYALMGQYIPGALGHRGIDFPWLITHSLLSTEGAFGVPIGVSARFVFLFVLFAAALDKTGGGQFFLQMAYAILGKFRGGPAKVAIFGSALMGTMSGSAVANVAGTGCITIPMMKKLGYDAKSSAAIEAVASSGGLVMPPIMGAAAFIMSEFLGIPYLKIVIAAIIPAILYYVAVFASVDFKAARLNLKGLDADQLPKFKTVLKSGYQYIIPLLVLVVFIIISTPQRSAFWGFVSAILIYCTGCLARKKPSELKNVFSILEDGSKQALPIIAACGVAGIVVGVISLTGLGFMLSGVLMTLGGHNLFIVLFISMLTSLVLGMGLPVTACYIILAVLAAPGIIDLGVNPIAAHLFIIYFGVLSGITPPVALAAYVGAGISKAKPMSVAIEACMIGLIAFFLPYMFIYNPVLLLQGITIPSLIISLVSCLIGAVAMSAGLQGYLLVRLNTFNRFILVATGILLFIPNIYTYTSGFILVIITIMQQVKALNKINRQKSHVLIQRLFLEEDETEVFD